MAAPVSYITICSILVLSAASLNARSRDSKLLQFSNTNWQRWQTYVAASALVLFLVDLNLQRRNRFLGTASVFSPTSDTTIFTVTASVIINFSNCKIQRLTQSISKQKDEEAAGNPTSDLTHWVTTCINISVFLRRPYSIPHKRHTDNRSKYWPTSGFL